MLRIRKIIQLAARGLSQRKISKAAGVGRNTLSFYLGQITKTGKSYQALLELDDAALSAIVSPIAKPACPDHRLLSLEPLLPDLSLELNRTGVTKLLLWEEYRSEHADGYGYTQFKKHLNRYIKNHQYSFHNVHQPGMEMQVDFAGKSLHVTDKRTGEMQSCPVLICTLPFSGLTFVIALVNARQESFYSGLNKALMYFGGVPARVKSDNMRQWVKRANRYEPTFNDAALQWGLHYQTELVATRVGKPKDKAHVESHVNIVYQRIYARIRHQEFYSLQELNARILELLEQHNHKPLQSRPASRAERFHLEEKPLLAALPREPFPFKFRKEFIVNSTYHSQIASEQHFYSIPSQYVGQKAVMIYDYENVEIYVKMNRVAFHKRSYVRGGYTTQADHMPEHHRAYKRSQEYNADYYLRKALQIGPYTKDVVTRVLNSRCFVQQAYKSCAGIISLTRKYPQGRIESACRRASTSPVVSYAMIKNILQKNLDTLELEQESVKYIPPHENIRGPSVYN